MTTQKRPEMPSGLQLWLAIVLISLASAIVLSLAGPDVAATTVAAPRSVTASGEHGSPPTDPPEQICAAVAGAAKG